MSGKYLCESVELGCQLNRFLPRNKVLEVCHEDMSPVSVSATSRSRIRRTRLFTFSNELFISTWVLGTRHWVLTTRNAALLPARCAPPTTKDKWWRRRKWRERRPRPTRHRGGWARRERSQWNKLRARAKSGGSGRPPRREHSPR